MSDFNLDSNVWYQIRNSLYDPSYASLRVGDGRTAIYMFDTNVSSTQQQWQIFPVSDGGGWNIRAAVTGPTAYISECQNSATASFDIAPAAADICMALGDPLDPQRRWILSSNGDGTFNVQLNVTNPVFEGFSLFVNASDHATFTNDPDEDGLKWSFHSIAQINDAAFSTGLAGASTPAVSAPTPSSSSKQLPASGTARSASTATASSPASPNSSKSGLSTGVAAGIGVAIALVVLAIGLATIVWILRRRRKRLQPLPPRYFQPAAWGESKSPDQFQAGNGRYQISELHHTPMIKCHEVAELPSDARPRSSRQDSS